MWSRCNDSIRERFTLAVAVSGCASTVGVRALSAATHDDDCDLVFGVVGEVVVGKID